MATLRELASYMDKQPISSIEVKILSIRDPKRGEGQYGPWVMQGGSFADSTGKHDFTITDEAMLLNQSHVGKTMRYSCTPGNRGPAGVAMAIRNKDGKDYRSIKIDNRALVEVLGDAYSGSETPAAASSSAPASKSTQQSKEPAEDRVANWMKLYDEVSSQASGTASRDRLEADQLTSITTAIWLSFRGDYGAYQPPFFRPKEVKKQEQTLEDSDEIPF